MKNQKERTELSGDTVVEQIQNTADTIKLSGPATDCLRGYTRAILKHYLFRKHAGAGIDGNVEAHLQNDHCRFCQREVIELEADERYLFDENYQSPVPHVDVVKPRRAHENPNESLEVAELADKLTKLLKTPAESYPLSELSIMYARVRSVKDAEKRRAIVEEVKDSCQKRWKRVAVNGAPVVELAAAQLLTRIKTLDGKQTVNTHAELGLKPGKETTDFLNYLMTTDYFFNLHGQPTWEVVQPPAEPRGGESAHEVSRETIDLNVAALREALASDGKHEASGDRVPLHG